MSPKKTVDSNHAKRNKSEKYNTLTTNQSLRLQFIKGKLIINGTEINNGYAYLIQQTGPNNKLSQYNIVKLNGINRSYFFCFNNIINTIINIQNGQY